MKPQSEAQELAIAPNHGGIYGEYVGQGTRWKLHPGQYDILPIRTSTLPVRDNFPASSVYSQHFLKPPFISQHDHDQLYLIAHAAFDLGLRGSHAVQPQPEKLGRPANAEEGLSASEYDPITLYLLFILSFPVHSIPTKSFAEVQCPDPFGRRPGETLNDAMQFSVRLGQRQVGFGHLINKKTRSQMEEAFRYN
ncbi:hypothetical protein BJX64DRAFT_265457 [Aspergillus heterothallicus]